MCPSCGGGSLKLAQMMMRDLDLSKISITGAGTKLPAPSSTITVYHGGTIITMKGGSFSAAAAMAIRGDTILAVGSDDEVKKAVDPDADWRDIEGRCILPGFIEPHLHVLYTAVATGFLIDFNPERIRTRQEALKLVKDTAGDDKHKSNPRLWISGNGYDPSRVENYEELDRDMLDACSPENPVYIMNLSGHLAYVNSSALERAGKNEDNTTVEEGFMRYENGRLSGVLEEQAVSAIGQVIDQADEKTIVKSWTDTLNAWAKLGYTSICDLGIGIISKTDATTYSKLTTAMQPPVRFFGALAVKIAAPYAPFTPPLMLGRVRVQAIKLWADGSTQGFTGAVKKAYNSTPPSWGQLIYKDEDELYNAVEPYFADGWQIAIHSNGDRATDQVLHVYEELYKRHPQRAKLLIDRIDHFTVTDPEQVKKAGDLGLGISHTMGHVCYWGRTFQEHVLNDSRAERIHALKDDVDNDIVFSLHSDSPVTEPKPLLWIRTAVTRLMRWDEKTEKVLGEDQKISLESALCATTINPAKQLVIDKYVGTLEVGKLADFVILDKDPRKVQPEDIHNLKVIETVKGGVCTYSHGKEKAVSKDA